MYLKYFKTQVFYKNFLEFVLWGSVKGRLAERVRKPQPLVKKWNQMHEAFQNDLVGHNCFKVPQLSASEKYIGRLFDLFHKHVLSVYFLMRSCIFKRYNRKGESEFCRR